MSQAFKHAKLQYTGRAFRQDADQAMRNDILRGLIEAITNADDAYGERPGEILVHVHRAHGKAWSVSVLDHATGIALRDMEKRLGTLGGRTSGHERGVRVRGNRGRGAKDLAAYGSVRWDSIIGGEYGVMEIDRDGRYRVAKAPEIATLDLRARVGIAQNGTLVTIFCRGNVTRPRFETLVTKLERCVPLRDIMQSSDRRMTLVYLDDAPLTLRYVPDQSANEVECVSLLVPGFPGLVELTLDEAREPMSGGPGDICRENGILIKSGRAVHEATLFGYEMDPYAAYFSGSLRWESIDELVREFDRRDEQGREPTRANPFSMISRMREGLEKTHPAYEALRRAIEPVLERHIARKRAEHADAASETPETRRRLSQLSKIITRFRADKEDEFELELSTGSGSGERIPALCIIPPLKRIEFGETATLGVQLRRDVLRDGEPATVRVVALCAAHLVNVSPEDVILHDVKDRKDAVRGNFTVRAEHTRARVVVEASVPGVNPALATIEITEPILAEDEPFEPPTVFRFEQERYALLPGKKRFLMLLAPSDLVEWSGVNVSLRSEDVQGVQLRDETITLRRAHHGKWFQGRVCVEARRDGATVGIVARLGESLHEAVTSVVVGRENAGPSISVEIGQFEGFARARRQEDSDGNVTITINALHPAARRYMGDPPVFCGQDSLASRLLIAEIVAEEVVRDLLSRKYRSGRVEVDAYYLERLRLLSDLLPRCHQSQIASAEAESLGKPKASVRSKTVTRENEVESARSLQPELFT